MRVIQNLFFAIIAFFASTIVISFFLPEKYTVEDSIEINAPVSDVFRQVNNLNSWKSWSYFYNLDSNWTVDFGNWTFGKDASFRWQSEALGDGQLAIVESYPNKKIKVHFKYEDAHKNGDAEYIFKEINTGTKVTFRLEFPVPLTPKDKFENLFFKKDNKKPQFDYSLKHLKEVSEYKFRENLKSINAPKLVPPLEN
ncbi:MAG TPA: hypothetical protein ENJ53_10115 [Phaeodactylibacter sp.]|nr:hypothetical protein [Phaeodactylibacter sp.]